MASAAPVIPVVASARTGVRGSSHPRAPLSSCLVPEVPAEAALVQKDSVKHQGIISPATGVIPPYALPVGHIKKTFDRKTYDNLEKLTILTYFA